MYAVAAGDYSGQYIVPMQTTKSHVNCFTLPDQKVISVPIDDYNQGIKNKLLEEVAELETDIYNYLYELYKHESNHN